MFTLAYYYHIDPQTSVVDRYKVRYSTWGCNYQHHTLLTYTGYPATEVDVSEREGIVSGYCASLQSVLVMCSLNGSLYQLYILVFQTNHKCIHLIITCGHPDSELL